MRKLALICAAALAVVSTPALAGGRSGSDGYVFDRKERFFGNINFTIVEHDSIADLRAAADAYAEEKGNDTNGAGFRFRTEIRNKRLVAWSIISGNRCIIHVVDPEVTYEPEWLGHEMMHCIYGNFHEDH